MYRPKVNSELDFNSASAHVMHMDLNSCFATIEQQANPFLRGKPLVVAAYTTDRGCILAASIEAKRFGIKTGMRVMDGKKLYPRLIVLPSDPWKYRNVHLKLRQLISDYTNDFSPKSIDEFVLNMNGYLSLKGNSMRGVAEEIKQRIKSEIGDWLTVSVGIAPNRYLAKIGAGLHKPDGLDEITVDNFLQVYSNLRLTDLTGIKERNAARLNSMGIYTVKDFYFAPIWKLKAAFHSITGLYWHTRLRGYEVDDAPQARRSYGNSTALGARLTKTEELSPVLARLTEKMCSRLRAAGYKAYGIHLMITYKDGSFWHKGRRMSESRFDSRDFYKAAFSLLLESQARKQGSAPVLNIAVSCFDLIKSDNLQLDIFEDVLKKEDLTKAGDRVNKKWGDFTVGMARSMGGRKAVKDRIAFGGVKELEELLTQKL
jgi:DNA polymerase-4